MTDRTMGDSAPLDWEQLARFIAGELPVRDREDIERRLRKEPADAALVDAVRELSLRITPDLPAGLDVERALARTKARAKETPVIPLRPTGGRTPLWQAPWLRVAAVAAIAVVGAFLLRPSAPGSDAGVAEGRTYRGRVGHADSVQLADGSLAVLAPGAALAVPLGYGERERTLRLTGQGWFRAQHDEARPFTVHAGDAVVRDLGTAFSVRPDGGAIRVAVHEGSVAVRSARAARSEEVTLVAGDVAAIAASGVEALKGGSPPEEADWASGELHFRDVSMEELARTIREWTGLVIQVADPSLLARRIRTDVTLSAARAGIEEAALGAGAEVRWQGDTAFVSRRGTNR